MSRLDSVRQEDILPVSGECQPFGLFMPSADCMKPTFCFTRSMFISP